MSLVNPIKYLVYDGQTVPNEPPPVVLVPSDDMSYGRITVTLPQITTVTTLTQKIYQLAEPTTANDRWLRQGPDLYATYPEALDSTGSFNSGNKFVINWQFLPAGLPDATNGNFYSVEFFVNQAADASRAQVSPKLICKIKDFLE
jgi:hypothetical protein